MALRQDDLVSDSATRGEHAGHCGDVAQIIANASLAFGCMSASIFAVPGFNDYGANALPSAIHRRPPGAVSAARGHSEVGADSAMDTPKGALLKMPPPVENDGEQFWVRVVIEIDDGRAKWAVTIPMVRTATVPIEFGLAMDGKM
jgi:hypothetical protein